MKYEEYIINNKHYLDIHVKRTHHVREHVLGDICSIAKLKKKYTRTQHKIELRFFF